MLRNDLKTLPSTKIVKTNFPSKNTGKGLYGYLIYLLKNHPVNIVISTNYHLLTGANKTTARRFRFRHVAASVGKFSKKCFTFSNSTILSNYRPLTTFILSFHPWARLRGLRYCAITQSAGYGRTRRDLVYADLTTCTTCNMICCTRTVADPGEGPAPP